MKKVTWDGKKFNLNGNIITEGNNMSFDVLDAKGKKVLFKPNKGITIVSAFPALNTTICDQQAIRIAKAANMYKGIAFVSITTDAPEVIDQWCITRKYGNTKVYSDYKRDFGDKTNTIIKKKDMLARGFMVFKDGTLVETAFNDEISVDPNYDILDKYFKR